MNQSKQNRTDEKPPSRGRRQLMQLFGIAFATLGLAWLTYFLVSGGKFMGTTNHGAFVDPPMNIDTLAFSDPFATQGKWWLWFVAESCEKTCAKTMHDLKSIHVLLNRDSTRVARAMFTLNATAGDLTATEKEKVQVLDKPSVLPPGVYIVDPLGNLVLRYPVDTPPKPVLEDLKKLLKLSQIG
jgi:hypothetical protein